MHEWVAPQTHACCGLVQIHTMCVALLTLATMVHVERVETKEKATFVRLGIWRPELKATVCWKSQKGKGTNTPGAVPASALGRLRVDVQRNNWSVHVQELDNLTDHEPVSSGRWLLHMSRDLHDAAAR